MIISTTTLDADHRHTISPSDTIDNPKHPLSGRVYTVLHKGMYGAVGVAGTFLGRQAGCGYAVRIGSPIIYNAVYAKTIESSGLIIGSMTAAIAGNSAVGAALPALSFVGSSLGGILGFAIITLCLKCLEKVIKFLANSAIFSYQYAKNHYQYK